MTRAPLLIATILTLLTAPAVGGLAPGAPAPPPTTGLPDAADLAKVATADQARALGVRLDAPTPPEHDRPSQAAEVLADAVGQPLDADDRAELAELDRLPAPVREDLTDVIDAFLAFQAAGRAADGPGEMGPVLEARNRLLDTFVELDRTVDAQDDAALAGSTVEVCPTIAVDTAGTSDTYTEDCVLVLDLGGDDVYHNNAGGAYSLGEVSEIPECGFIVGHNTYYGEAALFDASGDDLYGFQDEDKRRNCGANGGGIAGNGLLVDGEGEDTYQAGRAGVNGGGHAPGSSGFLLDAGTGDDLYNGTKNGVNGGSFVAAVGGLVDQGGTDTYLATDLGVNGGVTNVGPGGAFAGTGILLDGDGSGDRYVDDMGGTGEDRTVLPKGLIGAQIDR